MARYIVGALLGAGLVVLLGATGDQADPTAARIARLEQDRNLLNNRISVLERRVSAVERKLLVPGQQPATVTDPQPENPPATPPETVEQPVEPAVEEPAGADEELKKRIRGLRTANYDPVEGLENMWRAPLQQSAGGGDKGASVTALIKLRYIGSEDFKDWQLHFKVIYTNRTNTFIGMSEFCVEGERLHPDRDYLVRHTTQLRESYSSTFNCKIVYLNKTKIDRTPNRYNQPRK